MFCFVVLPDVMTPKITMTKHLQQLAKTINLHGVSDVFGKAKSTHSGCLPSGKHTIFNGKFHYKWSFSIAFC